MEIGVPPIFHSAKDLGNLAGDRLCLIPQGGHFNAQAAADLTHGLP